MNEAKRLLDLNTLPGSCIQSVFHWRYIKNLCLPCMSWTLGGPVFHPFSRRFCSSWTPHILLTYLPFLFQMCICERAERVAWCVGLSMNRAHCEQGSARTGLIVSRAQYEHGSLCLVSEQTAQFWDHTKVNPEWLIHKYYCFQVKIYTSSLLLNTLESKIKLSFSSNS